MLVWAWMLLGRCLCCVLLEYVPACPPTTTKFFPFQTATFESIEVAAAFLATAGLKLTPQLPEFLTDSSQRRLWSPLLWCCNMGCTIGIGGGNANAVAKTIQHSMVGWKARAHK